MNQLNSLHVLMLAPNYPPDYTTLIGRHVYYLSTALAKIGVKVSVITYGLGGSAESETVSGVEVHRVISPFSFYLDEIPIQAKSVFNRFLKMQNTRKVDILHIHDWKSAIIAKQICESYPIPLVVSYHALASSEMANGGTQQKYAMRQIVEQFMAKNASYLLFKNQAVSQQGQKLFQVDTDRFGVVPYGVLHESSNVPLDIKDFHNYFLNVDDQIVCMTGCENMENREAFFAELVAIVTSYYPSLKFIILTSLTIGELLRNLRLDDKVIILEDSTNREILRAAYQCSSVLVIPANDSRHGLTMVESMSCRTPIFTFGHGGLEEYVKDQTGGFHISSEEPHIVAGTIIDICKNKENLEEMRATVYEQYLSKYSVLSEAESTLLAYKRIIQDI